MILKIWAVDAGGAPHHPEVVFALDEAFEGVVCVACYDPDGLQTEIYPPVDDVAAVQSLLREHIPDIDFGTDDGWIFG